MFLTAYGICQRIISLGKEDITTANFVIELKLRFIVYSPNIPLTMDKSSVIEDSSTLKVRFIVYNPNIDTPKYGQIECH